MRERKLYVTIDTEMDADIHWYKKWPKEFSSVTKGIPKLLRPIWDKYDIHPIYFVSPEVVQDDECCRVLTEEIKKGAVIGAHLHGEYIDPEPKWHKEMEGKPVRFPCYGYSIDIERQKIINLTVLIQDRLGVMPVWYRAARFGADLDTVKILKEVGYRYDASITPYINWSDRGGPDHSKASVIPYIISDDDYYTGESISCVIDNTETDKLIEMPVTILGKRWGVIGRLLPNNWLFYRWLRPTHMTYIEQKHLIRDMIKKDASNIMMMFHSMEVMIGKSPYVRWKWMQRYYLWRLEKTIAYSVKQGFR